jgi:hypothetical protein
MNAVPYCVEEGYTYNMFSTIDSFKIRILTSHEEVMCSQESIVHEMHAMQLPV